MKRRKRALTGNKHVGDKLCEEQLLLPFNTACCHDNLPAAGYRNNALNNRGSNGNYWSGSLNESNSSNAWNLNFNSNGSNVNNNYRENGQSVRPGVIEEITGHCGNPSVVPYHLSKQQLLVDLLRAYKDARRHKRRSLKQVEFEMNMEEELISLRDDIWTRRYRPSRSVCFIITDPKKREVFAAQFRDRIVHHLYYNYVSRLFERTFIADSYSCRKGKGTHYGVKRLQHHIRSCSRNYCHNVYVLKGDLKGYFMSINRELLLKICNNSLRKMAMRRSDVDGKLWIEIIDYDVLFYLSRIIILTDPVEDCIVKGAAQEWNDLPASKSLFKTARGCGLPIGNLTSQLFSNVFLNCFDQFMKRKCGASHYGRYVDDFYVVDMCKWRLKSLMKDADDFLWRFLSLRLHPDKTFICEAKYGVEFLGAYVKPYRNYVRNSTLKRMSDKIQRLSIETDCHKAATSLNSFLGILSHYRSWKIRKSISERAVSFLNWGSFSNDYKKFQLKTEFRELLIT